MGSAAEGEGFSHAASRRSTGHYHPTTVDQYLNDLKSYQLLDANELHRLRRQFPAPTTDASALVEQLVRTRALTQFQAEKVWRGHGRGLHLGEYRILCPVGRGGIGIVYLACERRSSLTATPDALFALKVLPPKKAKEEPRSLLRFVRESEIGLRLPEHPSLTRTLDFGRQRNVHYLVLEYVPGSTLRQIVLESGPLLLSRAARIFADVAMGLHQAHLAGFVHRDFKPSNVIVMPNGRSKLLDFGFAVRLGEAAPADPAVIGGPGYTMGTMDYVAPEQTLDAATVGPKADLYSIGCSFFLTLTGRTPFIGGTTREKIRRHRSETPPGIREFLPGLPTEIVRLVEELLAKQPNRRPASAQEVAERLIPFAESLPIVPESDRALPLGELILQADQNWQRLRSRGDGDLVEENDLPTETIDAAEEVVALESVVQVSRGAMWWLIVLFVAALLMAGAVGWWLASHRGRGATTRFDTNHLSASSPSSGAEQQTDEARRGNRAVPHCIDRFSCYHQTRIVARSRSRENRCDDADDLSQAISNGAGVRVADPATDSAGRLFLDGLG